MLVLRIYGLIWLFLASTALIFYLTGYLSPIIMIFFGKIFVGMAFIGIMGMLPLWAAEQLSSKDGKK